MNQHDCVPVKLHVCEFHHVSMCRGILFFCRCSPPFATANSIPTWETTHRGGKPGHPPTHTHTSSPPPSPAPSLWLVCLPSLLLFGHRALSAHCKIVHVCFSLHFFFLSLHALLLSLPILPSTLSLSFSGYYIAKINTHCL